MASNSLGRLRIFFPISHSSRKIAILPGDGRGGVHCHMVRPHAATFPAMKSRDVTSCKVRAASRLFRESDGAFFPLRRRVS